MTASSVGAGQSSGTVDDLTPRPANTAIVLEEASLICGLLGEQWPRCLTPGASVGDAPGVAAQILHWLAGSGSVCSSFMAAAISSGLAQLFDGEGKFDQELLQGAALRSGQDGMIANCLAPGWTMVLCGTGSGKTLGALSPTLVRRYFDLPAPTLTVLLTPFSSLSCALAERAAAIGLRVLVASSTQGHGDAHSLPSRPAAERLIDTASRTTPDPDFPEIVVATYDWLSCTEAQKALTLLSNRGLLDCIVVDECQELLASRGYRTSCQLLGLALRTLGDRCPVKLLSGALPPSESRGLLQHLGISSDVHTVRSYTTPPNVRLFASTCQSLEQAHDRCVDTIVTSLSMEACATGARPITVVVFVSSQPATESLAMRLRQACGTLGTDPLSPPTFFAVCSTNQRQTVKPALAALRARSGLTVVVATSLLCQGFDFSADLIIVSDPYSMSQVCQALGRCGRNGQRASQFHVLLVPSAQQRDTAVATRPFFGGQSIVQFAATLRQPSVCLREALACVMLEDPEAAARLRCANIQAQDTSACKCDVCHTCRSLQEKGCVVVGPEPERHASRPPIVTPSRSSSDDVLKTRGEAKLRQLTTEEVKRCPHRVPLMTSSHRPNATMYLP